jgi:hypothetical protein
VSTHQITLRSIPEDCDLNTLCREHIAVLFVTDGEERLNLRYGKFNTGTNLKRG